jgi:AAHS family 4-hydroxybenzoate transporter-like MFS transporter
MTPNTAGPTPTSISELLSRHPVTARQYAITVLAALALIIDGLDIQLLSLVSPVLMEEWKISRAALGPALAAALVGMSLGASMGGWLGDRYGRKRVLASSTVAFGTATILGAATSGTLEITVLRLLSGIGFGAAAPNAIALAAEWLPPRMRPRLASLLSVGTPLGGLLGAVAVLGWLPEFGWRGCFVICGSLTDLLGLIMLGGLSESPALQAATGRTDAARVSLKHVARIDSDIVRPDHELVRTLPKQSVFTREYLRLNAGASLAFFSIAFVAYAVITWSPVLLTGSGFTLPEALRATMAFNIAAVGAALINSLLIDRFGSRAVLLMCGVGILVSLGGLLYALTGAALPGSKALAVVSIGASGGFTGAGLAAVYALLTCAYPSECRSAGIGFGMMMGRLGAIATIVASGYLLGLGDRNVVPFVVALSAAAGLALCGSCLVDRHIAAKTGLRHLSATRPFSR